MKIRIFFVSLSIIRIFIVSFCFAKPLKGSGCPTEYFLVKDLAEAYQAKTGQVIMPGRRNYPSLR